MILVTVTYREEDPQVEKIIERLHDLRKSYEFKLIRIQDKGDVDARKLPLIEIGPYRLRRDASETELLIALKAAQDRSEQIDKVDSDHPVRKPARPEKFTFWDKMTLWHTRHYMAVINTIVGLFVGIPFLAPIFMELRLPRPAQVIYAIYAPLCHQLSFRSWFLFGEQPIYPRKLAHLNYPITYEALMGTDVIDGLQARQYIGDEIHGYKVAICERDVAMYGSFFLFGVIFSIWKGRIRQIKWWLWILVGIVPIGIDGASQISGFGLQISWLPARESTPLLRTITGVLFGVFTAWYLLPMIDESVRATHRMLVRKQEILRQSGQ
jgi:uncharacterized membrane protein